VNKNAVLILLIGSHFLLNVDTAIIEVALPSVKADLDIGLGTLSWVANVYILAFGGFLLPGARLGDLLGGRRVFTAGLLLFAASSLLGTVATTPLTLLAARAGQGLAAAVVSPTALSLLMRVFPDGTPEGAAERKRALATLGAVAATGGTTGYFAGGALCDVFGWPSVFLVNVPLTLTAAWAAVRLLPADPPGRGLRRVGAGSAVLVCAGMTLLVYVLVSVNEPGRSAAWTATLGALALAALAGFFVVQRSSPEPLVPLRLFRRRAFRGAGAVAMLINAAIAPVVFFLSLYVQQVRGLSPLGAGLALVPLIGAVTFSSALAGRLLRRFSERLVMGAGLALFGGGVLWLSRAADGGSVTGLLGPECVVGLGGGLVFVTFTVSGTNGQPQQDAGSASGVLTTAQKIGASLGLAVLTNLATGATRTTSGEGAIGPAYSTALLGAAVPVALAFVAALAWIPGKADCAVPKEVKRAGAL